MAKHILFNRLTPWQSAIRCSTNIYAALFIKMGYRVSYLQGMVHVGQVLLHRGQYESWRQGPRHERGGYVFTPFTLMPTNRRGPFSLPFAAHMSYRLCIPSIRKLIEKSGYGEPDIIWTATPGASALGEVFPKAVTVFQVVDYYSAFAGPAMRQIEKNDYERVDHVFSIGHALTNYLRDDLNIARKKITTLGQGALLDTYQGEIVEPEDFSALPRPRAIWVGVLKKGDPELFKAAAETMQSLGGSVALIGPGALWADELREQFPNVWLAGPRDPDLVPHYLRSSDIGLMLYDRARSEVYRGQNPLKLYEYAAAGLPIISTPHDEFSYTQPPARIVNEPEQVMEAIKSLLVNAESERENALRFAMDNSWEKKAQQASDIIQGLM